MWVVYILRLKSGKYYVGLTSNTARRFDEHFGGGGCRTTAYDPPVAVEYQENFVSYANASKREYQLKRWSHAKKRTLIQKDLRELHRLARRRRDPAQSKN